MSRLKRCSHPGCEVVVYWGPGSDEEHCWNHMRQLKNQNQPKSYLQCQFGVGRNQCPNPARAGGLCTKHYQRLRRTRINAEKRGETFEEEL